MNPISRTQAWCKLAVLIAEKLPAPKEIRISGRVVAITLDDLSDFDQWRANFDARLDEPFKSAGSILHEAMGDWAGFILSLKVHVPYADAEPEPITEDMSKVREIAGAVSE